MKQITSYLTLILTSFVLITACKKADFEEPLQQEEIAGAAANSKKPGSSTRIKTRTQGTETITFTYDAKGRLVSQESSINNDEIFAYSGKTAVTTKLYNPSGVLVSQSLYTLNSDGLATSASTSTMDIVFTYNAAKQKMSQEMTYPNGDIFLVSNVYVDGDLEQTESYHDGTVQWWREYTYYTDKPNTLNNEAYGKKFLGAESQHLLKSMIHVDKTNTMSKEDYVYEFDADSRVIKIKVMKDGVVKPDIIFTYY